MSDAIVHDFFTFLTTALLAFIAYRQKLADDKVKTVKTDLAESNARQNKRLDSIAEVADKTHILVNSERGKLLTLYAMSARLLATETNRPEHARAAELAEIELAEHNSKQAEVDAQGAGK